MTLPIENLTIDGQRLDARVESRLLPGAEIVRTMRGASSVTLEFHDPDGELRRSGVLTRPGAKPLKAFKQAPWRERLGRTVLVIDGRRFRLAGVAKQGRTLRLTFEGEIAALLRTHDKALKSSRADVTRGQFVIQLVREVKARRIRYVVSNPGKRQPIADVEDDDKNTKRDREIGKDAGVTIKGAAISKDQRENLNTALDVATRLDAPEVAMLALLVGPIGESSWETAIVNPKSGAKGVFQILPRYWDEISWDDIEGGSEIYLNTGFTHIGSNVREGAIQLAKKHPDWTPGKIADAVEGGGAGEAFYQEHIDEARQILAAYGGAGTTTVVRESYSYARRKGEDSWACTGRLADEVAWHRFEAENTFYFVEDKEIFKSAPRMVLNEDTPGVVSIDYDIDYGKPVSTVTVECRAERWIAPEGSVIELDGVDELVDGRWLVDTVRQKLQRADTTIELRRPAPSKPEPAPRTRVKTTADLDPTMTPKQVIDEIVLPLAHDYGIDKTVAQNDLDNANHKTNVEGSTRKSWHKGPPEQQWAADMSNGNAPTPEMDQLADALAERFDLPKLDLTTTGAAGSEQASSGSSNGFNYQLIYRSKEGGNHDNHVHFGVQVDGSASTSTPATGAGWHPDAKRVPFEDAGSFVDGAGAKIVHHTTEGDSIAGAEGAYSANRSAPHFTFDHDSGTLHQHIPISRAARSLEHAGGTRETNRARAIQIEHVGRAAQSHDWSSADYARIAALCRWIEENAGVPRSCDVSFAVGTSRMSGDEFFEYTGHCGHMHVPGNDHTDPSGASGAFRIDLVI